MNVKSNCNLPSRMEIKKFESKIGRPLPSDFISFLINYNVIELHENIFATACNEYYINAFYPFGEEYDVTLESAYLNLKEFFEAKYIPFADDYGGWQYIISLNEEDYGKVYFCRMDEALEDALTLLADSFEEFINKLEVSPDESV